MKKCNMCKEFKDESAFHKNQYRCKPCISQYAKDNREKIEATRKVWREKNAEEIADRSKARYDANPEKRRAQSRATYAKYPEQYRERARQYRKTNPDKAKQAKVLSNRAYKARKRSAQGNYTADDIRWLMLKQRGKCAVCRDKLEPGFHVDHIEALSKGGANEKLNLQLLCPTCNNRKHAKDPIQFMQENGFLL